MKRLQSAGVGSKKRQAEVLAEDEELLWQKGLHPIDTCRHYEWLLFCFAKRQRAQTIEIYSLPDWGHRKRRKTIPQIHSGHIKNHPGGLHGRKMKQNVVIHSRPSRVLLCEVVQVLPYPHASKPSSRCCYLQPSHHPISTCWFSAIPLGHYSLGRTISRTCKVAGIGGYKTNHSLRTTAATRLYQSGVDEQLVMERTGERSLKVFAVTKEPQTGTFWHPQLL